jgi:hypothetical protein
VAVPAPGRSTKSRLGRHWAEPFRPHQLVDYLLGLFGVEPAPESVSANILPGNLLDAVGAHPVKDSTSILVAVSQTNLPQTSSCMRPKIALPQPHGVAHHLSTDLDRLLCR